MEELETRVQKQLLGFCKMLPLHVEKWKKVLEDCERPAQALSNYADQLRHVEKTNIKYMERFEVIQQKILYRIYTGIEEEIATLKRLMDQLNEVTFQLKNKLTLLERSTLDLDWEAESILIRGSAIQPPLETILQCGLQFWMFFSNALKSINEKLKRLDVRNQKFMMEFENSFKVDLECDKVRYLMALVQYVDDEKGII